MRVCVCVCLVCVRVLCVSECVCVCLYVSAYVLHAYPAVSTVALHAERDTLRFQTPFVRRRRATCDKSRAKLTHTHTHAHTQRRGERSRQRKRVRGIHRLSAKGLLGGKWESRADEADSD